MASTSISVDQGMHIADWSLQFVQQPWGLLTLLMLFGMLMVYLNRKDLIEEWRQRARDKAAGRAAANVEAEARASEAKSRANAAELETDALRNAALTDLRERLVKAEMRAEAMESRMTAAEGRERECLQTNAKLAGQNEAMQFGNQQTVQQLNDAMGTINVLKIRIGDLERDQRDRNARTGPPSS